MPITTYSDFVCDEAKLNEFSGYRIKLGVEGLVVQSQTAVHYQKCDRISCCYV